MHLCVYVNPNLCLIWTRQISCILHELVWMHFQYNDDIPSTDHILTCTEIPVLPHHDEELYGFKSSSPNTVL